MDNDLTSRNSASDSQGDVAASFNELIASAEELLRSTASYSGAEIEAARGRLKNQLELARQRAAGYENTLRDGYRMVSDAADKCVHEHAWKALGVAALAGLVMGKCLSSGEHRRH